jgi:hypothetical protein
VLGHVAERNLLVAAPSSTLNAATPWIVTITIDRTPPKQCVQDVAQ